VEIVRALYILGAETRLAEYEAVLYMKLIQIENNLKKWELTVKGYAEIPSISITVNGKPSKDFQFAFLTIFNNLREEVFIMHCISFLQIFWELLVLKD
jgi:hypothetical protein